MEPRFVYITASSQAEAEQVARLLVERRLAACCNILPGMTSIYRWEGKIETAAEVVLVAKTAAARVPDLIEAVRQAHSYQVPCVVTLPILEGNPAYLAWLRESL